MRVRNGNAGTIAGPDRCDRNASRCQHGCVERPCPGRLRSRVAGAASTLRAAALRPATRRSRTPIADLSGSWSPAAAMTAPATKRTRTDSSVSVASVPESGSTAPAIASIASAEMVRVSLAGSRLACTSASAHARTTGVGSDRKIASSRPDRDQRPSVTCEGLPRPTRASRALSAWGSGGSTTRRRFVDRRGRRRGTRCRRVVNLRDERATTLGRHATVGCHVQGHRLDDVTLGAVPQLDICGDVGESGLDGGEDPRQVLLRLTPAPAALSADSHGAMAHSHVRRGRRRAHRLRLTPCRRAVCPGRRTNGASRREAGRRSAVRCCPRTSSTGLELVAGLPERQALRARRSQGSWRPAPPSRPDERHRWNAVDDAIGGRSGQHIGVEQARPSL